MCYVFESPCISSVSRREARTSVELSSGRQHSAVTMATTAAAAESENNYMVTENERAFDWLE